MGARPSRNGALATLLFDFVLVHYVPSKNLSCGKETTLPLRAVTEQIEDNQADLKKSAPKVSTGAIHDPRSSAAVPTIRASCLSTAFYE